MREASDVVDDGLEFPSGLSRLLWRSWIVGVTGVALWPAFEVAGGRVISAEISLVALAWVLLLAGPVAGVVAWRLAASPRPAAPRFAMTVRLLGPRRRRELDRSLRLGDTAVAARWPSYARARVAQHRRELITLGPIIVLIWSQLLLRPGGSWFWGILLVGIAATGSGISSVVRQLRREHALASAGVAGSS